MATSTANPTATWTTGASWTATPTTLERALGERPRRIGHRAAVRPVGHLLEREHGARGVLACEGASRLDTARAPHDRDDVAGHRLRLGVSVDERGEPLAQRRLALERADERQGRLALDEVLAEALAEQA